MQELLQHERLACTSQPCDSPCEPDVLWTAQLFYVPISVYYHTLRKTVTCDTFSEARLYILSQSKEGNQEKCTKNQWFYCFAVSFPLADAPFSMQSYCPGEWSSTAMLTGRGLNDRFPQTKDLGISLTFPCHPWTSVTIRVIINFPCHPWTSVIVCVII